MNRSTIARWRRRASPARAIRTRVAVGARRPKGLHTRKKQAHARSSCAAVTRNRDRHGTFTQEGHVRRTTHLQEGGGREASRTKKPIKTWSRRSLGHARHGRLTIRCTTAASTCLGFIPRTVSHNSAVCAEALFRATVAVGDARARERQSRPRSTGRRRARRCRRPGRCRPRCCAARRRQEVRRRHAHPSRSQVRPPVSRRRRASWPTWSVARRARGRNILKFSTNRAARIIKKVLDSAIANAGEQQRRRRRRLKVQMIMVDDGPRNEDQPARQGPPPTGS